MNSLIYCYWTVAILVIYFMFLLMQKRYRLLQPSVVHTAIWLVTVVLIIFELNGFLVSDQQDDIKFRFVSKFICFMMLSSVIGFVLAHFFTSREETNLKIELIEIEVIDAILTKFKWIPYLCGFIGILLFVFIISSIGNWSTFSEYRSFALSTERIGYAAFAQRISGHVNVLGMLYLMLLGYKYGREGIHLLSLFKYAFLCSIINMSIGGRVWIVTSILPIMVTYTFCRHYSSLNNKSRIRSDNRKIIAILVFVLFAFSFIGILRSETGKSNAVEEQNYVDKLLYLTDGSKITNMVLSQYPPGTFNLEYGKSEFLSNFINSPMMQKFNESIEHNIGLLVTVKSVMPNLYFDFGFWGGIIMWGIFCFFLEFICIWLKYRAKIIPLLFVGVLSLFMFQSPITNIFSLNVPRLEWIIIIYLFRKRIFRGIIGIEKYI